MEAAKPIVLISKCITFDACRYDKGLINSSFVLKLRPYVEFKTVCPEVAIGLGTPRAPIRLKMKGDEVTLFQPATQKDLTKDMHDFSKKFLHGIDVDGVILKYGSPSCGLSNVKIYKSDNPSDGIRKGSGMFARHVLDRFKGIAIEDEGRLNDLTIREHWLTKLFTIARFRSLTRERKALVDFHTKHKYLLMAYNEQSMRRLGRIVAEAKNNPDYFSEYYTELLAALRPQLRAGRVINVLQHMYGPVGKHITKEEREHFMNVLEEYRDERVPLTVPLGLIKSWAFRFKQQYVLDQVLLEPYPKKLFEMPKK